MHILGETKLAFRSLSRCGSFEMTEIKKNLLGVNYPESQRPKQSRNYAQELSYGIASSPSRSLRSLRLLAMTDKF